MIFNIYIYISYLFLQICKSVNEIFFYQIDILDDSYLTVQFSLYLC